MTQDLDTRHIRPKHIMVFDETVADALKPFQDDPYYRIWKPDETEEGLRLAEVYAYDLFILAGDHAHAILDALRGRCDVREPVLLVEDEPAQIGVLPKEHGADFCLPSDVTSDDLHSTVRYLSAFRKSSMAD